MQPKKFFFLLKESFLDLIRNPFLIVFAFFLWLLLFLFSKLSVFVNYRLANSIALTVWLIFFYVVYLALLSFFFSGLIGVVNKQFSTKELFPSAKKFFLTNFVALVIIALVTLLLGRLAHYIALYLGIFLKFSLPAAQTLFLFIYFVGLIGVLIFLNFSIFFSVTQDLKLKASIKASVSLVRREYFTTLSLNVLLFIFFFAFNKIPLGIAGDLIDTLILIPYFAILFTKFVLMDNSVDSTTLSELSFREFRKKNNIITRILYKAGNLK